MLRNSIPIGMAAASLASPQTLNAGAPVEHVGYGSTNARMMVLDYQSNLWTIYAAAGGTVLAEYTEFTSVVPTWTKSYTYLGSSQLATASPNGTGGEYVEFNHPDSWNPDSWRVIQ